MTKRVLVVVICAVLVIAGVAAVSFFVGHQVALRNLSFKTVSPTQAAEAMQKDEFYSDYKENTLIIRGAISSIQQQNGGTTLGLKTSTSFKLFCSLKPKIQSVKIGDEVTIEAIGGNAERQPAAVLLKNCIIRE